MSRLAFIKGNDAVICGALSAGCRAFFGYPITPASEIAHDAMKRFPEAGALALQAESEVAAINMLYGAGASGTPAMTATSGPGFSLMQEGISYMAAARLPGVIVDVMRSGPGLGNIGPEQADYFMAVKGGGHGHYHNIVLAPASVQEMFSMTAFAFEAAFRWQMPVIVLADAFIGQVMETIELPEKIPASDDVPCSRFPMNRAVDGTSQTAGNVISSLELVPPKLHVKNDERFAQYDDVIQNLHEAEVDICDGNEPARMLVVAFGICARIAHEAVNLARNKGLRVSMFRPKTLWPFPENELERAASGVERVLVVECNRGMMQEDVERFLGRKRVRGFHIDGGIIPTVAELFNAIVDGI